MKDEKKISYEDLLTIPTQRLLEMYYEEDKKDTSSVLYRVLQSRLSFFGVKLSELPPSEDPGFLDADQRNQVRNLVMESIRQVVRSLRFSKLEQNYADELLKKADFALRKLGSGALHVNDPAWDAMYFTKKCFENSTISTVPILESLPKPK